MFKVHLKINGTFNTHTFHVNFVNYDYFMGFIFIFTLVKLKVSKCKKSIVYR